jgi:general secretion pathway protein E
MEATFLGLKDGQTFTAAGCPECNQTGYKGRTGIYELLTVDEKVRQMIHAEAAEEAVVQAIRASTRSIRDDGIQRVRDGRTTLEEVLRVTQDE